MQRTRLVRVGTLAFVVGALIMIVLHESSHAVAGALLGYTPVQLPFAVDFVPPPTRGADIVTAATGPLFSLVSGLVGVGVDRALRPFRSRPFWRLVWLWAVFASVEEGFGYFFIAGMVSAGDTAQALTLLGVPQWHFVAATAFGVGGLFLTAFLFSAPVTAMSSSIADKRAIAVWPWLYGTIVFVALMVLFVLLSPSVGIDAVVAVLSGAVATGVYAPLSMIFRRNRFAAAEPPVVPARPVGGFVLLGLLVALDLVLTTGVLWA